MSYIKNLCQGVYAQRIKELCVRYAVPLIIIADLVGIIAAVFWVSVMDIIDIDLRYWIPYLQKHNYLAMYHEICTAEVLSPAILNYPPIYPTYLFFLARCVLPEIVTVDSTNATDLFFQVAMKSSSVIFMIITQAVLYVRVSKKAALVWTYCLPLWYISFVWGQRDVLLGLFIVMMLYSMHQKKIYEPCLWFVAACLLKPQSAYLAVIYFLYLFTSEHSVRQKLASLGMGLAVGLAAYMPFMIYEQDLLLPFKVYLRVAGFGTGAFSWCAANFYWILNKCNVANAAFLVPVMLLVIIGLAVIYYLRTKNIIMTGFVYMFMIFMFSIGQHERYTVYHMCIFSLIYILYNKFSIEFWTMSFVYGLYLIIANTLSCKALLFDTLTLYENGYLYATLLVTAIFNFILLADLIRHKKELDNLPVV